MPKKSRKSAGKFSHEEKNTIRDAVLEDLNDVDVKNSTAKFFGKQDLELELRSSTYSLIIKNQTGIISAYANFNTVPNISALPQGCWLNWMQHHYGMTKVTYGNTLFMTFLITDDPYNSSLVRDLFQEIYLKEPKVKFICTVAPPIDSIYEEILKVHCQLIPSLDVSINRLSQSIFVCERNSIIPKMRLRRALAEDNDDLVEIIDEKLKTVRYELGDYYISELVLREDPSENIIVAEISNVTIGMIWINTNIHLKALAENFEIAAYGFFIRPQEKTDNTNSRTVIDLVTQPSELFFNKPETGPVDAFIREKIPSGTADENRISLYNLYICSSDSSLSEDFSEHLRSKKNLFEKWEKITKTLKSKERYIDEAPRSVPVPKSTEVANVFAIQLFGLSSKIDPRRIFDLMAAAFAAYPDKDYCIFALSSAEASSDCLGGSLLKYFSRVIPLSGCKISDCLYVTHRNSFLAEIELDYLTHDDVADVENMLCLDAFQGTAMYNLADILQQMQDYLQNPSSIYDILVMRCRGSPIGYAILRQNCMMSELHANFVLYDDDDAFPDWKAGELRYLQVHPVFIWEWIHIVRQILRLTEYFSLHYRLIRENNQPVVNNILLHMFPIFPRKRIAYTYIEPYALYYLNAKMVNIFREQLENKIVIVGFNEVCKGFLRTLIYSPAAKYVQCLNITIITECPGFIEAECDLKSFEKQQSMFFQSKNQFDAEYLRRLEFRTFVRFTPGPLKGINSTAKRIILDNDTHLRYDQLFLMCSSRYSAPTSISVVPANYLEINGRLDKIIFYQKIRILVTEHTEQTLPIIVYGSVVMAHSCLSTLIDLGVKASQICFVIPKLYGKFDFPETFDDDYISNFIYNLEENAGVQICKNLKFIGWKLRQNTNVIESVTLETQFSSIELKCLAFISFFGDALSRQLRETFESQNIKVIDKRIVIDQNSRTNIPYVYACGRITQYQGTLFAKQNEQRHFNQIEVGNQLAKNFIKERRTGELQNFLDAKFVKPIFRQAQLIDGFIYGGLRKPGRYIPRDIRRYIHSNDLDLVTVSNDGEYCRISIDKNGFVAEISCLTKKYASLNVMYRIYGLHHSLLSKMKTECESGKIKSLLDYIHKNVFSVVIHDQFPLLREDVRAKNFECLREFLKDGKKVDKHEIQKYLKSRGMEEMMQKSLMEFIKKHWKSLHPYYALPNDFLQ